MTYLERVKQRLVHNLYHAPLGSRKLLNAVELWQEMHFSTEELDRLLEDRIVFEQARALFREEARYTVKGRCIVGKHGASPDKKYLERLPQYVATGAAEPVELEV